MSGTILIIGLAHGLPIVAAGVITKKRPAVVTVTIAMAVVAFTFGGIQYVAADLAGVLVGLFFGYALSDAQPQNELTLHIPTAAPSTPDSSVPDATAPSGASHRENPRNKPIHSISDAADVFVSSFKQTREKAVEVQRARTKAKLRQLAELEVLNRGLTFASDDIREAFIQKFETHIMAELNKSKR